MIKKIKDLIIETKENMRGGEKTISILHFASKDEMKSIRLFSEITIPPDGSIGVHEHKNETEYFIITEGSGIVFDNGVEKKIEKGDVIITSNNESHSVRNNSSLPLKMIALINTF